MLLQFHSHANCRRKIHPDLPPRQRERERRRVICDSGKPRLNPLRLDADGEVHLATCRPVYSAPSIRKSPTAPLW